MIPKNKILRKHLGELAINNQAIRYAVYEAMEEYAAQFKQTGTNTLVIGSVCPHTITYVDDDNLQRCQNCEQIVD